MQDLPMLKGICLWIGGLALGIVSIVTVGRFIFTKPNKEPKKPSHTIFTLLGIELLTFLASGMVIAIVSPDDLSEYVSFAAPCAAAVVVGIGVVFRAIKGDNEPFLLMDYYSYFLSIGILFFSFVVYLASHTSTEAIAFSGVLFCAFCFLGYMYVAIVNTMTVLKLVIAALVFIVVGFFAHTTWQSRADFAAYDLSVKNQKSANYAKQDCCCDLNKHKSN